MSSSIASPGKQGLPSWGIVSVLALLFALLGALQYHWTQEISRASSTRMQVDLQTAMTGFRHGLWRELGEVCTALRPPSAVEAQVDANEYLGRFVRWRGRALHPELVDRVYLWDSTPKATTRLTELDAATGKLQRMGWPTSLTILHELLQRESAVLTSPAVLTPDAVGRDDVIPGIGQLWGFDQNLPAMIHPVFRKPVERPGEMEITWIIILLNKDVLEKMVLPELAQAQFGTSGLLDFKVAVLAGNNDRAAVLYSSDPGFGDGPPAQIDAESSLWNPAGFPMGAPPTGGPMKETSPQGRENGPSDETPILFRQFHYPPREQAWRIVVAHRSGSIQEAMARGRRRDLAASLGILLLLAATMAVLVVNTYRARRLARLQLDFVTGITHELRTPLAVILSAAENMEHGTVNSNSQFVRYGEVIHRQAKQLLELVEQVLLFAVARQSSQRFDPRPVEVAKVIDATLEKLDLTGVTVHREVAPDLPRVSADFAALSRCLENLMTNAIKYGGETRWLGVEASKSNQEDTAREVTVTIKDRGIGIAEDELPHIFDPFYRSPAVASSSIHGTGLGLPLATSMVKEMGGTITVVSQEGVGSSFTLHLPALEEAHAAPGPSSE